MSRFARHKDASHKTVVAAFKAHGCSVLIIDCSAKDAWDLEVGFAGVDHGVEVKPTMAQASRDKRRFELRPSQQLFHDKWRGAKVQVVRTVEDVAALVGMWRHDQLVAHRAALLLHEFRSVALVEVGT